MWSRDVSASHQMTMSWVQRPRLPPTDCSTVELARYSAQLNTCCRILPASGRKIRSSACTVSPAFLCHLVIIFQYKLPVAHRMTDQRVCGSSRISLPFRATSHALACEATRHRPESTLVTNLNTHVSNAAIVRTAPVWQAVSRLGDPARESIPFQSHSAVTVTESHRDQHHVTR